MHFPLIEVSGEIRPLHIAWDFRSVGALARTATLLLVGYAEQMIGRREKLKRPVQPDEKGLRAGTNQRLGMHNKSRDAAEPCKRLFFALPCAPEQRPVPAENVHLTFSAQ